MIKGPGDAAENAEAVRNAANIFAARGLFQTKTVKVTVCTMGPSPESFAALSRHSPGLLAWGVHAVNSELRKQLMPSTRYSTQELRDGLIDALSKRPLTLRTVSLEVTLLNGINDSVQNANELAAFAQDIVNAVPGCRISVNLTPFTKPSKDFVYEAPSNESVVSFQKQLWKHDIETHVIKLRGDHRSVSLGQM